MPIQFVNEQGKVFVSEQAIAVLAGSAALECYGLVGMSSRKQLKDGIADLLGKENQGRGVVVRQEQDLLHIDLYVIVSYGTNISQIAHNIQDRVKYVLHHIIGLQIETVNIYVQGVRVQS